MWNPFLAIYGQIKGAYTSKHIMHPDIIGIYTGDTLR